jgi:hypothetical protein
MTDRRPRTEAELVEFVRAIDVRAPESLRASVHGLIVSGAPRRSARPGRAIDALVRGLGSAPRLAAAGGALAAIVLVIALSLGGAASGGPSLRQTAALTLLPATAAAPAESQIRRAELAAAVDGVPFPYWEERLGWRSTGSRSDRVGGRQITTVFYANDEGRQVGYAIVAGLPAPHVSGGEVTNHAGTSYRLLRENGAPVVTWVRAGHMCVVSGHGVDAATLLRLASWHHSVRV